MTEISSATDALSVRIVDAGFSRCRPRRQISRARRPCDGNLAKPRLTRSAPTMQKISAYILTYNEAEKIAAAVSSVLWADEVVVNDSFSVDRTAEIATSLGARIVEVPFNGFGGLRNRAIEACKYDWLFSLDADERCTEEVRDEILKLMAGSPAHDIYLVPRRSYMMGRWIRGSGWYPNFRQPPLFRKGSMRYTLATASQS